MQLVIMIFGLFILLVAYFLFKKTASFLTLVKEELKPDATKFFHVFGWLYIVLGLAILFSGGLNKTVFQLVMLFLAIVASAIFTIGYSFFIKKR
jgi:Na+-driven multidrug efflux pump